MEKFTKCKHWINPKISGFVSVCVPHERRAVVIWAEHFLAVVIKLAHLKLIGPERKHGAVIGQVDQGRIAARQTPC